MNPWINVPLVAYDSHIALPELYQARAQDARAEAGKPHQDAGADVRTERIRTIGCTLHCRKERRLKNGKPLL